MLACARPFRRPGDPWALLALGALAWCGSAHAQSGPYQQVRPELTRSATGLFGFLHHPLPALPNRAFGPSGYAAADLDGDGHLDLMAATASNLAYSLLGDGTGFFGGAVQSIPLSTPPGRMALGDVDGDGDPDAYLGANTLLLNDGAGSFSDASTNLPPSVSGAWRFLTDVELDGDLDVVTWGYNAAHTQLQNDGLGHFTDWSASMPALQFASLDIVMGDVDGDGDADTLTGSSLLQPCHLFRNQAGTYVDITANLPLPPAPVNTAAVALEDVDGDGDLDALTHRQYGFGWWPELQRNDGTGLFVHVPGATPFTGSRRLEVGDLDGDGDPDLLSDRVLWNDGSGTFTAGYTPWFGSFLSYPVLLVDADEDDDLDAIVLRDDAFDELYLNDGSGFLASSSPSALEALARAPFVLGDLDGDQDPDMLHGSALLLNDGSGSYQDVSSTHLPAVTPATLNAAAVGDLDLDGDADLVLAQTSSFQAFPFRVYLNEGDAHFHEPPAYPALVATTKDVALGDVDGDGHLDAFFAASPDELLLLGDGSGGFSDGSSALPADPASARAVALGDLDGDGYLDAVVGHAGGTGATPNVLYANDGAGLFAVAFNLPALVENTEDVHLEDVDLDGDPDLLVANGWDSWGDPFPNHVYRNEGAGVFVDAPGSFPTRPGEYNHALATGDVDGDGDPELLVGAGIDSTLLLNDGSGRFLDVGSELPLHVPCLTVALADVDGDGDLDAVYDRFLMQNLRRQVAWRWRPRAGQPLILDHYGRPGVFWWIYGSLGLGRSNLPPYGTLLLNPVDTTFLASGSLNARGTASYAFAPAQLPGMAGQTLYVQSVIGAPLLFSNLEVVDFTNR